MYAGWSLKSHMVISRWEVLMKPDLVVLVCELKTLFGSYFQISIQFVPSKCNNYFIFIVLCKVLCYLNLSV